MAEYLFSCIRCSWKGGEDKLAYMLPPFGVGVGIPVCPQCGAEVTMVPPGQTEQPPGTVPPPPSP